MTPRVSVVMANYNYARYLRAAIDSVLGQTLADLELIVVDDGSTDDSRSIIETYLGDPRMRFLPVDHLGQPRAKNAGIEQARAPLVAFLDADDIWRSDKLEKQTALFDRDPLLGVVYSRRCLIDEDGRDLPERHVRLHRGNVLAEMFQDNFVCFSSAVVRRLVFEHLGRFDPNLDLAIDFDFWLRVAGHYRFDFVDEPLVSYRCGHGNLSRRVGERLKIAIMLMHQHLHRGAAARLPKHIVRDALARTYWHMGIAMSPHEPLSSVHWFGRALWQNWRFRLAWRGLLGAAMPAPLRRMARRLLGRSGDWENAYRTSENDPANV